MAIKMRKSEDYLHSEVILNKITEYDIFSYYCTHFIELGQKFISDLRVDAGPTVSIIPFNGKLLYKDFGRPGHTFDCFHYVKTKYGLTFRETLQVIDTDFGLGLCSQNEDQVAFTQGYIGKASNKKVEAKKSTVVRRKSRPWNIEDSKFWKKFLISKSTLTKFNVEPLSYYWINDNRFTCNSITYLFNVGKKCKIYAPNETEHKWTSNTTAKQVQGWAQLPPTGDLVILTSSLKDVMCLYEMGYDSVALQSEMQMPEEKFITNLQSRFKQVALLYDNDYANPANPGQTMAAEITSKYPLTNIVIPSRYECKDISDFIAKFGDTGEAQKLIELQI